MFHILPIEIVQQEILLRCSIQEIVSFSLISKRFQFIVYKTLLLVPHWQSYILFFKDHVNKGMWKAAKIGDFHLVNYFIKIGADDWDWGLKYAVKGLQETMVNFFINYGADVWNFGLIEAAKKGDEKWVEFFIKKGAEEWTEAMMSAARAGHKHLVQRFMMKLKENMHVYNFKYLILAATLSENKDLIEFVVENEEDSKTWMGEIGSFWYSSASHSVGSKLVQQNKQKWYGKQTKFRDLWRIVKSGNLKQAKMFLNQDKFYKLTISSYGQPSDIVDILLIKTIKTGHYSMTKFLINRSENLDYNCWDNVVHAAYCLGSKKFKKLLDESQKSIHDYWRQINKNKDSSHSEKFF